MDWVMTKPAKWNQMVLFLVRKRCTTKVRTKILWCLQYEFQSIFHLKSQNRVNSAALVCSSKQRAIKIAVGCYEKKTVQKEKNKLQTLQKKRLKYEKKTCAPQASTSCVLQGELLSPCRCDGSVRCTHQSCLIRWISERGSWSCELCYFKYQVLAISTKNPLQVENNGVDVRNTHQQNTTL